MSTTETYIVSAPQEIWGVAEDLSALDEIFETFGESHHANVVRLLERIVHQASDTVHDVTPTIHTPHRGKAHA
jgi:hypothetical protein